MFFCVPSIELPNHLSEQCRSTIPLVKRLVDSRRKLRVPVPLAVNVQRSTFNDHHCLLFPPTKSDEKPDFCPVKCYGQFRITGTVENQEAVLRRTARPKLCTGQHLSPRFSDLFFTPLPPNYPAFPLPSSTIWLQSLYIFVTAAPPSSHIIHLNSQLLP